MNIKIIQKMKKLLTLSLTLVVLAIFAEISVAQTPPMCDFEVIEGDLFPGGIGAFGVSSGPGSIIIDHINTGTGTQSITVVGVPDNAVINIPPFTPGTFNPVNVTYTPIDPNQPVHFRLRAANAFHAIFIDVWCGMCVPPPNSTMVAWYPFDETAGPTAANLATGNTGTHINNPTPISGKVDGALRFNGIDNYVESPSTIATNFGPANTPGFCQTGAQGSYSSCLGDFSIDAWIRLPPNAPTSVMTIVDKRDPVTDRGYHLFVLNNQLGVQLTDSIFFNYLSISIPTLRNGLWHHVAVTVDRRVGNSTTMGEIRWYHNGAEISPLGTNNPINRPGSLANNSPLRIGTRTASSPLSGWFRGDIDELEIFNRVLSDAEVNSIYSAGSFGKCK